jgi:REP element-mobilizing transposase RayT
MMSNHFHLLLEVPPMVEGGLSDEALLQRKRGPERLARRFATASS